MFKFIAVSLCSFVIAGSIAMIDRQTTEFTPQSAYNQSTIQPNRIYASGIIEGLTDAVELRPETSGRALEVLVHEGDWVQANDVLVRFDNRKELQQLAASLARLRLAEANRDRLVNGARDAERKEARSLLAAKQAKLDQALLTWRRIESLRAHDAIAQQEADDRAGTVQTLNAEVQAAKAKVEQLELPAREDEVRAVEARVAAARAEYELANIALDKTELRAPQRGQVLIVNVEPGEASPDRWIEPALVLVDSSTLKVRAYVEELDAPRIALGTQATFTADGIPATTFAATVSELNPQMKPKTLTGDNPNELFDTKVREVVLDIQPTSAAGRLILGLRVDVSLDAFVQDAECTVASTTSSVSAASPVTAFTESDSNIQGR